MNTTAPTRLQRLLWLAALVLFIAFALIPISNRLTRAGGLTLFFVVWFGLMALCWHRRAIRFTVLGLTLLISAFLASPARSLPSAEVLRSDYTAGLRRYDGVGYIWGGESLKGIDCSGLIRRGLIDSLFWRGLCDINPGLVRRALSLWWQDCTANALGETDGVRTLHVLDAPSLNHLDHALILSGDLAVTRNGIHIMAYLGDNLWIEADPLIGRVITIKAPAEANAWFNSPMKIVRWSLLQP
jgi:hypothetical protein